MKYHILHLDMRSKSQGASVAEWSKVTRLRVTSPLIYLVQIPLQDSSYCEKVCQLVAEGWWFSPSTSASTIPELTASK
ncbi:hypothetical protein KUTeg_022458 [Tegillarca granosa]|uniref:Uncharacterized protein n=1 Tax=Tegillarca granosa TaxID=220873 RepID=A0ABQ9E6H0_TEGGR|nr:hypothetical protein KUTeg_022458 [Tegillarca granosa]